MPLRHWLILVLSLSLLPEVTASEFRSDTPVPMVVLEGDGSTRGAQAATHIGDRLMAIMPLIGNLPQFQIDETAYQQLLTHLDPDHLAEMTAVAEGAGVDLRVVVGANVALDSLCSVLVRPVDDSRPLAIARAMDFPPAAMIGLSTIITTWRRPDRLAVTGIGWPGYAGVVSGINQAGLTALVLMNEARFAPRDGVPVTFRMREILEQAETVTQAAELYAAETVASDHFVVFADASSALVVWQTGPDGHTNRRDPRSDGWLTCSNGAPRPNGRQRDHRTRVLERALKLQAQRPTDDASMRAVLWRVLQEPINAQSMLLVPAERRLDLAVAGFGYPAQAGWWHSFPLGDLLDGGELGTLTVQALGRMPQP